MEVRNGGKNVLGFAIKPQTMTMVRLLSSTPIWIRSELLHMSHESNVEARHQLPYRDMIGIISD